VTSLPNRKQPHGPGSGPHRGRTSPVERAGMVGASDMATGVVVGSAVIPASSPPLGPKNAQAPQAGCRGRRISSQLAPGGRVASLGSPPQPRVHWAHPRGGAPFMIIQYYSLSPLSPREHDPGLGNPHQCLHARKLSPSLRNPASVQSEPRSTRQGTIRGFPRRQVPAIRPRRAETSRSPTRAS
jgi:hypothetical protein